MASNAKKRNLVHKILGAHLVDGSLVPGSTAAIRIDQTLTQDATGTLAALQFEAMDIPRVRTKLSVSYVDHNTLQTGFESADDHNFLRSFAAKYGLLFSVPGNGICHQVHLERFGVPGQTLLGSDSHTPTGGGLGMIAIGAGGLDVAVAMAGGPFVVAAPKVLSVKLTGKLKPWCSAKDIILEVLRRLTLTGGTGKILEYNGPGVATLDVPARATITNMGAELGATTSIFPSDKNTLDYLKSRGRAEAFKPMSADPGCSYDEEIVIDLGKIVPLVAKPHSPDNVVPVEEIAGTPVDQVCIGSCTNSSLADLSLVAAMLKGKTIPSSVGLSISPGSRNVLEAVSRSGAINDMITAGARLLECACGPCIGMGMSPGSGAVSVRSFNRNFPGRCGTKDAGVYLVSPATAAACALTGKITDPRTLGKMPSFKTPTPSLDSSGIVKPPRDGSKVQLMRGPNIKPLPKARALDDTIRATVMLKTGDNISTDAILPAGSKILPLRSNIPKISTYCFQAVDETFAKRALEGGDGIIVGGNNYGQGSSREHAALAPMFLGIRAVAVKQFARIHRSNLINFGILPLTFDNPKDYDLISQGDKIEIPDLKKKIVSGSPVELLIVNKKKKITLSHGLSKEEADVILAGGKLNLTKKSLKKAAKKK